MRLTLNGEMREFPNGLTLSTLLKHLELRREALVAEVNRRIIPSSEDGSVKLAEGDRVELIQFVGGG